ncbi:UDP-N-acetylmuramoyl-tripeptide--D-alanyl-D-alanine ligase [Patescibacteria group bacterium]|nr:UDP-N-acetylmuramoyl-tripeptide--D-alanyl-D-alanine ligase [Patescibacteria group bacterium]MBU2263682.1 UDP-N-acetylmuramoyl-tripeptide--D-alanyl-D-alanine ligase [Patescibacteria group bacterium]
MIKKILKKIIVFLLRMEARLILRKYKPKIVAVTGTVGKTSSKDAIYTILSADFYTRKSEKSYNSELGVPLTIIGTKSAWNNLFQWILVLFKGLKLLIAKYDYPQWLILEMGVDRPKDMKKLVSYVKPDIGVITALGETPVHVEYFKSADDLAKEKSRMVQAIGKSGYVILNADDKLSLSAREKTKGKILTFGFSEEADLTASNYHIVYKREGDKDIPEGITFKVDYKRNIIPVRLYDVFGKQAVYSALISMAVGSAMGMNLVEMADALSRYKAPAGRLRLLEGIKNTFILDDSYNSSPIALVAALEVLTEVPAKRKIAVLGDMLELGKYTIDEHKKAGREVKKAANLLFIVGPRSKFTAEEARIAGFKENNIFEFSTSDEAKLEVQKKIKEGDLILIKGSQSMRMEKIVEEIMAHPENKKELLVRQEKEWSNK